MMGKRLKIRIPSFSFHCYRSRDIISSPPSPSKPSKSHHSSLTRHVSSAFNTIGCGCLSKSTNISDEDHSVFSPPSPPKPEKNKKKMKKRRLKKKKPPSLRFRISTSSTESGIFSSESFDEEEEEVETETLVSSSKSISFSSGSDDSSHLETIRENPYKIKKKKKKKVRRMKKSSTSPEEEEKEEEMESPARLSVFQRLIPCTVDGKVRESYAVVKKSEDPYEDFKRSMMEMIMEKQIFDEKDLEQLLHCLLSLNQKEHHPVIVEAFSEIWKSIFSTTIH